MPENYQENKNFKNNNGLFNLNQPGLVFSKPYGLKHD